MRFQGLECAIETQFERCPDKARLSIGGFSHGTGSQRGQLFGSDHSVWIWCEGISHAVPKQTAPAVFLRAIGAQIGSVFGVGSCEGVKELESSNRILLAGRRSGGGIADKVATIEANGPNGNGAVTGLGSLEGYIRES